MKSNTALKVLIFSLCLILTACGAGVGGGGGGGGGGGIGFGTADNARLSIHSNGTQGDGNSSSSSISSDGRYVAFESDADNLIGLNKDNNNFKDIFVHDRDLSGDGTFDESGDISTIRVSVNSNGEEAEFGNSTSPSISADGRYVAFASDATNLLTGSDSNNSTDIFLHDLNTSTTIRVSVKSDGSQATGNSTSPSISSDSRYVAFASDATDLIGSDLNVYKDIFVHDRDLSGDGTFDEFADISTILVSVKSGGTKVFTGNSYDPSISADGRHVAFTSDAIDFGGDTNFTSDIFVHDLDSNNTTRVSISSNGGQATGSSTHSSISSNGRYVAFVSDASDIVTDSKTFNDIFVHDRDSSDDGTFDETGDISTIRISVNTSSNDADGNSFAPSLSADGTKVAFASDATDIVTGDTNNKRDIFIGDLDTSPITTTRISVDLNSSNSDNNSFAPSVSSDGSYVAFESDARDIVSGDTNNARDIFVNTP